MSDDEDIAAFIAKNGVTPCCPAYCAPVNNPKPLKVPVYDLQPTFGQWHGPKKSNSKGAVRHRVRNETITKLYKGGADPQVLADEYGLNVKTIHEILIQYGGREKTNVTYPVEVQKECVELYKSGLNAEAVGRKTGVSSTAIRKWVRLAGVPVRKTNVWM